MSTLFVTPWTVAHQAPLSMDSPGKNTGVGSHLLLQGIFLTQGSDLVSYIASGFLEVGHTYCVAKAELHHMKKEKERQNW